MYLNASGEIISGDVLIISGNVSGETKKNINLGLFDGNGMTEQEIDYIVRRNMIIAISILFLILFMKVAYIILH